MSLDKCIYLCSPNPQQDQELSFHPEHSVMLLTVNPCPNSCVASHLSVIYFFPTDKLSLF